MVSNYIEMAHVLGLKNNPFLGGNPSWQLYPAIASLKERYKNLKEAPVANLNFSLLDEHSSKQLDQIISKMSDGEYVGFGNYWYNYGASGHAYSLHVVKRSDQTHFIYFNRGQRHYDKSGLKADSSDSVLVFSIDNNSSRDFAKEMFAAARSFYSRSNLSKFIHQHSNKINHSLSSLLMKGRQKTGNCTVANLNIVWHYQLASDAMQADQYKSFADAYTETKKIYRHMRTKDQVEAFKYLLNDQFYPFYRAYFYDCMEVLIKFVEKDVKNKSDNHIKLLVNSADDKILNNLINLLLGNKFFKNMELYIDEKVKKYNIKNPEGTKDDLHQTRRSISRDIYFYRDKVLAVMLETLPKERQKSIIKQDISLLKLVAPEIQRSLLDEDFNKYALYARDDLKNTFPGYQKKAVESKYLEQGADLSREFKASRNIFLSNSTRQKEIDINNKLRFLYSYAIAEDKAGVSKAFKDLCLTCCKQRFCLADKIYSVDTKSAHWLIARLSKNDPIGKELRSMLDIKNAFQIKEFIESIVVGKNNELTKHGSHTASHSRKSGPQK